MLDIGCTMLAFKQIKKNTSINSVIINLEEAFKVNMINQCINYRLCLCLLVGPSVRNKIKILRTLSIWVGLEREISELGGGDMLVMTMMSVHVHASMHIC